MAYDYARPFAEVDPILEFTSLGDLVRQMQDFARRHQRFRAGVADTSFFPFSAICKLVMTFPSGSYGGTGFYIGPGLILTAGHNVLDRTPDNSGTEAATAMTIRAGQQQGGTHLSEFHVTAADWTAHPQWAGSNATNRSFDMAVIRVTTPPPGGQYFEIANYSPVPETPVAVCGYSGQDVASDRQHLDIDRIRRLGNDGETVEYNLQTRQGGSGSPVFLDFVNSPGGDAPSAIPVMGVHVARGDAQHNRGVLLTPDKIDWARGGGIMSVAQGLSCSYSSDAPRSSLGGLPLIVRPRSQLGGLPLIPTRNQTPPAPVPAPVPLPATAQGFRARSLTRNWIVADEDRGMSVQRRTFGKTANDLTGKTTLEVTIRNMPAGGAVHWNIPRADDRRRVLFETGSGTSPNATGTRVTLRSLAPGVAHVDCMVKDASGTTVESNKYLVSSPHFVKVAFDPNVTAFLNGLGIGGQRQTIIDEMRAVTSLLYENVNVRFVMPGDTLPAHLDGPANAAFPGGRQVAASVSIINVTAQVGAVDPEQSHRDGATAQFPVGTQGRNHQPGDLPAPLNNHNISTVLLGHMRTIPEAGTVETALQGGGVSAANRQLAAQMYGRLLGEVSGHEFGHFAHGTFAGHNTGPDGLLAEGQHRSFAEMTGMAPGSGGAILTDNGVNGINRLTAANLRAFEEAMPVDPPLDSAAESARGRVGSFAVRPMSGETVHLPGATVLEGWQARALLFAIEEALTAAASAGNPAMYLANQMIIDFDLLLEICERTNISVGLGAAFGGGAGTGATAGAGIVFAPGRKVGFYGALSAVAGAVASGGAMAQLTVIRGGPENFGGASYTVGVNIGTLGWFDAGTFDVPVGAHVVFNSDRQPIGFVAELGVSAGVPGLSLIEGFGQAVWTETTFDGSRRYGRSASATDPTGDRRSRAIAAAIAGGANPEEAAAFVARLFP